MACITPRPILADDPLAYFMPLGAPAPHAPDLAAREFAAPEMTAPQLAALEQMYGYYTPGQP